MAKDQVKYEADLYALFLELSFTVECRKDQVSDLTEELKDVKKLLKANETRLEKVRKCYVEIFKKEPKRK